MSNNLTQDDLVLKAMVSCRTTLVEFPGPRPLAGANDYRIPSNPWQRKNITYSIANSAEGQPVTAEVKRIIREAFEAWQAALGSDFSFTLKETQEDGHANIQIIFYKDDEHSLWDKVKFSPIGENDEVTLAHAFYPLTVNRLLKGQIHINAFIPWEDISENGTAANGTAANGYKLKSVAIHEIGHALGLAHSEETESIMFPDYRKWPGTVTRHDSENIRHLYLHGGTVTVSTADDPRGGGVSAELVVKTRGSTQPGDAKPEDAKPEDAKPEDTA